MLNIVDDRNLIAHSRHRFLRSKSHSRQAKFTKRRSRNRGTEFLETTQHWPLPPRARTNTDDDRTNVCVSEHGESTTTNKTDTTVVETWETRSRRPRHGTGSGPPDVTTQTTEECQREPEDHNTKRVVGNAANLHRTHEQRNPEHFHTPPTMNGN